MWQKHKTKTEKRERRMKYNLMRKLGYNIKVSLRARDWRWTKVRNKIKDMPEIIG